MNFGLDGRLLQRMIPDYNAKRFWAPTTASLRLRNFDFIGIATMEINGRDFANIRPFLRWAGSK
jgi:hypothetical protein